MRHLTTNNRTTNNPRPHTIGILWSQLMKKVNNNDGTDQMKQGQMWGKSHCHQEIMV